MNRTGASLVEVILGVALIVAIAGMIGISFTQIAKVQKMDQQRERALSLGQEGLESLRSYPYTFLTPTVNSASPVCDCSLPENQGTPDSRFPPEIFSWNGDPIYRRVCIVPVSINVSGSFEPHCGGPSTGFKKIVVTIDGGKPSVHLQIERLIKDPMGPEMATNSGSIAVSGQLVTASQRQPLAGISVYFLNEEGGVVAIALSDGQGKFHKDHLEAGFYRLVPQLLKTQTSEPPYREIHLTDGKDEEVDSFLISGSPVQIRLQSNRDLTLVTASAQAQDHLPDIQFIEASADIHATIMTTSEKRWTLPEGTYWIECRARDSQGQIQKIIAQGGENRILEPLFESTFRCIFP